MTTINTVNATPKLDAWMVTKLFGASSQDQAGIKAAATASTIAPAAVAGGVANATAQALLKLKTGGDQARQADAGIPPHLHNMTPDEINALMKAQSEMTSDQLSTAMYGQGLENFGRMNTTFSSYLDDMRTGASQDLTSSFDTLLSDSDRQLRLSTGHKISAMADQLQNAYDKHEIKFQNVSDMKGLDYQDASKAVANGIISGPITYNKDILDSLDKDGKNHSLLDLGVGGVMVMTW